MHSIESLAREIQDLEPCSGVSRHARTLVNERLQLARGPEDSIELFIEGPKESFGSNAIGRSLEWGSYRDLNGPRDFNALVVRATGGQGSTRLMAHLAYEALEVVAQEPEVTNADLLRRLSPFISLVIQRLILSPMEQMGLTGELHFLFELINYAERQRPPIDNRVALSAWHGWDSASRDFSGEGVAVEVKATGQDTRRHRVHPISQLLAGPGDPDERVYVYSLGLRPDHSQSYGPTTEYDRILHRLDAESRTVFLGQLAQYSGTGFDPELRNYYDLERGFAQTHPPQLYRVDHRTDILRPEAFVEGAPPARALKISYELSLEGLQPCSQAEREAILNCLLLLSEAKVEFGGTS